MEKYLYILNFSEYKCQNNDVL